MIARPVRNAITTGRERHLAAAYAGAWLPYGLMYFGVSLYMAEPLRRGLLLGTVRYASAALLGLAIRALCARIPWPERGHLRFAAIHLLAAQAFGLALVT